MAVFSAGLDADEGFFAQASDYRQEVDYAVFWVIVPVSNIDEAAQLYEKLLGSPGRALSSVGTTSTAKARSWPCSAARGHQPVGCLAEPAADLFLRSTTLRRPKGGPCNWAPGLTT